MIGLSRVLHTVRSSNTHRAMSGLVSPPCPSQRHSPRPLTAFSRARFPTADSYYYGAAATTVHQQARSSTKLGSMWCSHSLLCCVLALSVSLPSSRPPQGPASPASPGRRSPPPQVHSPRPVAVIPYKSIASPTLSSSHYSLPVIGIQRETSPSWSPIPAFGVPLLQPAPLRCKASPL